MTRAFARKLSRRKVIGAALGIAAASPIKLGGAQAQQSQASTLVQQFYECVDAYQYDQAYALLGSKWHSEQSLETFTKGYSNTAFVQCETTSEQPASNGTLVHVKLISWHNDGQIVGYAGRYTVGLENGKQLILAGDNTLGPAPSGTPPLCNVDGLEFTLGPWQGAAGSRIGSIVAANRSNAICALGGSPRLTIKDANKHVLRSTSEPGSPPEAVIVRPGGTAHAPLRFSNWCGGKPAEPVSLYVDIPADKHEGTINAGASDISYPPCLGQGQPPVLGIRGWLSGAE